MIALKFAIIAAIFSVVAVLFAGLLVMARGGETSLKYGNKLMRLRVATQFIAFLLIALTIYLAKH